MKCAFALENMKYRSLFLLIFYFLISGSGKVLAQEPSYRVFETREGLTNENVYYAFQDKEGYIWFGTEGGVSRFDGEEFENFTTQEGLSDNDVLSIHEDSFGRLWFLTYSGQPTFLQEGEFHTPQNDSSLAHFPLVTYLSTFFQDRQGNIWIASDASGVAKISPEGKQFYYSLGNVTKTIGMFQGPDDKLHLVRSHMIQSFFMQGDVPVLGPENEEVINASRSCQLKSGKVLITAKDGVFELDPA